MWHWANNRFHAVPINNDLRPGQGYWVNLASPSNLPLGSLDNDTDGDEIPDYWEALWQFNYNLADDMNDDPDIDNLINIMEYKSGTDPRNQDTDTDGLIDGEEVNNFLTNPLLFDTDTDGLDDGTEINVFGTSALLMDTDNDGFDDGEEILEQSNPLESDLIPLTRIESSPSDGEGGVALTRETIVRFTRPLANSIEVKNDIFYAEFGGEVISARIHVGSSKRVMTLFYNDNLPASSRIRITIIGDNLLDDRNIAIDVDGDGLPGGTVNIDFETLSLTTIPNTAVCGRVFASELMAMNSEEENINQPLKGVTIAVDGMEDTLKAITDDEGNFRLEPVPSGRFFVHIDGRTVNETLIDGVLTSLEFPNGPYYPNVGKAWEPDPDKLETNIGNIYLPLIPAETLKPSSSTDETVLQFSSDFISENPQFQGVEVRVPPDSLFSDDGTPGGMLGIAAVPPNRLPGTLPPNLQLQDVITIQTDGATNFDVPLPICLPNLPDPTTGEPLESNSRTSLWSFNHDTGQFEVVGGMTVSENGDVICTDPGVGILAPGWHAQGPTPVRPWRPTCGGGGRPCCRKGFEPNREYFECIIDPNNLISVLGFGGGGAVMGAGEIRKGGGIGGAFFAYLGMVWSANEVKITCNKLKPRCLPSNPSPQTQKRLIQQALISDESIAVEIVAIGRQIGELIYPFIASNTAIPINTKDEIDFLVSQANSLVGGDAIEFMENLISEQQVQHDFFEIIPGSEPSYPVFYVAQIQQNTGEIFLLRGQTDTKGEYELFVNQNVEILLVLFYDPKTNSIAFETPVTISGRIGLPRFNLIPVEDGVLSDFDGDKLVDIAEFVLGTDIGKSDTDGDGVNDFSEIDQGLDPLDGLVVRTGIIGTASTSGTAVDIFAINDIVIIADSEGGVSVFNVFNGMNPIIIAQIDTPGTALAVSGTENLVGVADGVEGLAIIDISDPPNTKIIKQVGVFPLGSGLAQAIVTAGDLAFVGTTTGFVSMVELSTGVVLQKLDLSETVHDLAIEGRTLYAITGDSLYVLPFESGILELGGSLDFLGNINPNNIRGRLFVGGGIAYPVNVDGYKTIDVSNPESPSLIAPASSPQGGWQQMVLNGSGLGIAAVAPNPIFNSSENNIYLFDVSDPTVTNSFITQFITPGAARGVSIYNGIAYVADHNDGLQVVNYLAYDSQGNPPSITLTISSNDNEVSEGELVFVRATVNDDIQVRNVEFFVDGQRIGTDGNYPFEIAYRVPSAATVSDVTFTAFASDTGGNRSDSTEPVVVDVIQDNEPPTVTIESPSNNQLFSSLDDIIVNVTAVDNVGIDSLSFLVNDNPVIAKRASFVEWVIKIPATPGIHTLAVVATDNNGFVQTSEPVTFVVEEEAVSREMSVISYAPTVFEEAVSRKTSVLSYNEAERNDTVSREISIESKIE